MLPKGLNPSVANPTLTLRVSWANSRYFSSNSFHSTELARCHAIPSSTRLSLMDRAPPFLLAAIRPGSVGVRMEGEGRKKGGYQHFVGMPDFLLYLEFRVVIRRFTFTSRKEINFFLTFHCTHILKKRDKFVLNAVRGDFLCLP